MAPRKMRFLRAAALLTSATTHALTPKTSAPPAQTSWLSSAVLEAPAVEAPPAAPSLLPATWDDAACLDECAVEDAVSTEYSPVDRLTDMWAAELNWEHEDADDDEAAFLDEEAASAEDDASALDALWLDPAVELYESLDAAARAAGSADERPSWELVETFEDGVPVRLGGDDFVFVNEDACNGCGMCSKIAPATFFSEAVDGKGRAFEQGGDARVAVDEAIFACPRQAIHRVSFEELVRNERARVKTELVNCGAEAADGNAPDPLNMKCYTSHSCPQAGCYNCPMWRTRGDNPAYQEKETANDERRRRFLAAERAAFFASERVAHL